MNCTNCGTYNNPQSKFCVKCGSALNGNNLGQPMQNVNPNFNEQPTMQSTGFAQNINSNPNVQPTMQQSVNNVSIVALNYLMYFIVILLKPFKCFREEETKLNDSKTSIILALLVSALMTVCNMIKTIFTTVRVASFNLTDGYTYSWQWNNLKNIKWLELIGKNFLIYACIILVITLVFYLGSLIVKKQLSFIKALSIAATSVIPAVVGIMILSPLGGLIWSPLSIIFMIAGAVYTLVILYELINSELKLEGDAKIYFNLICFGILAIAGYYAYMKLFVSSVTGGLEDVLDMFNVGI